jgi:hypothetical protein
MTPKGSQTVADATPSTTTGETPETFRRRTTPIAGPRPSNPTGFEEVLELLREGSQ